MPDSRTTKKPLENSACRFIYPISTIKSKILVHGRPPINIIERIR
jgi:hypothetical protein